MRFIVIFKTLLMKDTQKQQGPNRTGHSDELVGRGKGQQGVDKAPGEEPSQDTEHVTMDTQKGKKVDADPSQESDRPINQ
jgi:hypothetical protein